MKFNYAWDSVEKENRSLKILVVALLLLATFLSVAVMATSAQAPLLVERGCLSRTLSPIGEAPTEDEMKGFAALAVKERFDTLASETTFLSMKQASYRTTEQAELQKQKMKQTLIVSDVKIEKDGLMVDADRLISIGEVRSTLRFPLKIQIERVGRSESNPYGLLLTEIYEIKPEVKK